MEDKSKILEKSILENLKKYGYDHTLTALNDIVSYNYYKGFTRDNNIRKLLLDNISNEDVVSIMLKNLNIYISDNFNLTPKDIKMLCTRYIKLVNKSSFN